MRIRKIYSYLIITMCVNLLILLFLWIKHSELPNVGKQLTGTKEQLVSSEMSLDLGKMETDVHFDSSNQTFDIILHYGNCKGTVFPLHLVETDTWHPLDQERSMYAFSAYMIRSKKRIFIIGAKLHELKVSAVCQMWKWEKTSDTLVMGESKAYSVMPREGLSKKYSATIIECPLNSSFVPTHVSLATASCGTPLNLFTVYDVITPEVYNHKFTVCLSPLFYKFGEASTLVEWFELNRILGADQFVIYNHSVASNVDHVLRYYAKRGLAKIIKWRPPMRVNTQSKTNKPVEIHYFGQTAALNDCLFRSKASSEFLVNIDLDEYIIPHAANVTDWSALLEKIEKPKAVTYMFRNTFFLTEWNNTKIDVPERELVEKFKLITLQKFDHEPKIFPPRHRSKYIVRTSGADRILIHEVPIAQTVVAPVEVGLVHHYRYWGNKDEKKPMVTDDTVKQKFGQKLIRNVRNVWKDLANIPINIPN